MWEELGISFGTGLILLIILYFVIKWAVKNGINQSMLFTDSQREEFEKQEMENANKIMNEMKSKKLKNK